MAHEVPNCIIAIRIVMYCVHHRRPVTYSDYSGVTKLQSRAIYVRLWLKTGLMLANMAPCAKYGLGNSWFILTDTLGLSQQTSCVHKQNMILWLCIQQQLVLVLKMWGISILHSYNYLILKMVKFGPSWQIDQRTSNINWMWTFSFGNTAIITANLSCWCL